MGLVVFVINKIMNIFNFNPVILLFSVNISLPKLFNNYDFDKNNIGKTRGEGRGGGVS